MAAQPFPRSIVEFYAVHADEKDENDDPLRCQLCHTNPQEREVYTTDMPSAISILPAHVQPLRVCVPCLEDPQWFTPVNAHGYPSDGTHWYYHVDGDVIEDLAQAMMDTDERRADGSWKHGELLDELNRIADTVNPW